jgi:hypothetical protein
VAEVSVVVGAQNAKETVSLCLGSLVRKRTDRDIEIIVVDSSIDGTAEIVAEQYSNLTLIRAAKGLLVPHLWGIGAQRASAPLVAFTTAQCIPDSEWVVSMLREFQDHPEFVGFGGAIEPPRQGSSKDWAAYFSRYSAFMPPVLAGPGQDIPGDNAVYKREVLDKYWTERNQGFWETLFHRSLRQSGLSIAMSSLLSVEMGNVGNPFEYSRVRKEHGRHYGSTRPETSALQRAMRIVAAPVLIPYLVARIGRRVASTRRDLMVKYYASLPWLIVFTTAWSIGEVSGYMRPKAGVNSVKSFE